VGTVSFKLINRSESQRLCDRAASQLQRWSQEWLSGELGAPHVTTQSEVSSDEVRWVARAATDGRGAAIGLPSIESLQQRLTASLEFFKPTHSPLFRELEEAAILSLGHSLVGTEGEVVTFPSTQDIQAPGSGYVLLRCGFEDDFALHLLLWPKTVEEWLVDGGVQTRRPRVSVSRMEALDSQTVRLEVLAGEAEIAFEEFRSLCEGVVIKLDRQLSQPMQLRLVGDGVVCAGHLGVSEDRRAVQIVTSDQ
jgi:flagellar motor switch/type III secretory pathway protein FliN